MELAKFLLVLSPEFKEILLSLRKLIFKACPGIKESVKWGNLTFYHNGPVCYIMVSQDHMMFGFWAGIELIDPGRLLEGAGKKMRHVKIFSIKDIDDISEARLISWVKQAVLLNK